MPIRPVDIIMMAPTSQEASIQKHAQIQKTEIAQAQLNHLFQNEMKHNSSQTIKATKTENNEFRYDAKEQGGSAFYEQEQQKKRKQDEVPEEETKKTFGSFDIKI